MRQCLGCGAKFVGAEQFCPYDGMAIIDALANEHEGDTPTLAGAKVGNYVLQQRIGSGGMGEVWRAEHPDIGRTVAIKILNADSANHKEAVERFFFEAKAANRTRHPNLIDIVDLGSLPATGQCYCVMEYLQGKDLSEMIRLRGRVSFDEALPWFTQMLDGLQAVHDQGILHRDLKPENIFLVDDPHRGEVVKILDFGVAKLVRATGQALTRVGVAMGTPMFMSPEQASGQKLDTRSDLYAVGVLLYVVLTGRYPFTGNTPTRILEKTVSEPPIPPSQVLPDIDPKLEALVLRCLEKDPAKRYGSAREMAEALGALKREREKTAEHPIVQTGGVAAGQLIAKPAERTGRRAAIFGGVAAVSVVAVLALVLGGLGPWSKASDAAATPLPASPAVSAPTAPPAPPALTLLTHPEGAEVLRGEVLLGVAPGPFLVPAGEILTVRAAGYEPQQVQAPLTGSLEVKLTPLVAAPPPAPSRPTEPVPSAPKTSPKKPSPPEKRPSGKPKNGKLGGLDG